MAHHSIECLSETGGFLDGVSIDLADGLNCFIGARGTVKTTALEFLRYGLDPMPDPKIHKDRKHDIEKARLGSHSMDCPSLFTVLSTQRRERRRTSIYPPVMPGASVG